LTRTSRRVRNLEGCLTTDAGNLQLQQQLAEALGRQRRLQEQLLQAEQARDAEAERLAEEDRRVGLGGAAEQQLPAVGERSDELDSSSSDGSPAASALVADQAPSKDVEMGPVAVRAGQQSASGRSSWLSRFGSRKQ